MINQTQSNAKRLKVRVVSSATQRLTDLATTSRTPTRYAIGRVRLLLADLPTDAGSLSL
jgi:hypothetical protein